MKGTKTQENNKDTDGEELHSGGKNKANANPRRSTRSTQPPSRLRDFFTYNVSYPIKDYFKYYLVTAKHKAFLTAICEKTEPTNFEEANCSLFWCPAMKEELQALDKNNTWTIMPLPKGKKLVGCKLVYKMKYNSDGTIEGYKVRLVAMQKVLHKPTGYIIKKPLPLSQK